MFKIVMVRRSRMQNTNLFTLNVEHLFDNEKHASYRDQSIVWVQDQLNLGLNLDPGPKDVCRKVWVQDQPNFGLNLDPKPLIRDSRPAFVRN